MLHQSFYINGRNDFNEMRFNSCYAGLSAAERQLLDFVISHWIILHSQVVFCCAVGAHDAILELELKHCPTAQVLGFMALKPLMKASILKLFVPLFIILHSQF